MVRGRSTPVILGGHFHVTRFGMFRSRAGPSTQPLVNGSQSTTAYRHRPFLHTQGVIRTAPPSRSRVKNDYSLIGMLSRGKFSLSPYFIFVMRGLDPAHLPLARERGGFLFPRPRGEGRLSEAKTGWGSAREPTPPLAPPHKGEGEFIVNIRRPPLPE